MNLTNSGTVELLYADTIYSGSTANNQLAVLTPYTSVVSGQITYQRGDEPQNFLFKKLESKAGFQIQNLNIAEGIVFLHTIPEALTAQAGQLEFSMAFTSADGSRVTTAIQTLDIKPSLWTVAGEDVEVPYFPVATNHSMGVVQVDGTTIAVNEYGVIAVTENENAKIARGMVESVSATNLNAVVGHRYLFDRIYALNATLPIPSEPHCGNEVYIYGKVNNNSIISFIGDHRKDVNFALPTDSNYQICEIRMVYCGNLWLISNKLYRD